MSAGPAATSAALPARGRTQPLSARTRRRRPSGPLCPTTPKSRRECQPPGMGAASPLTHTSNRSIAPRIPRRLPAVRGRRCWCASSRPGSSCWSRTTAAAPGKGALVRVELPLAEVQGKGGLDCPPAAPTSRVPGSGTSLLGTPRRFRPDRHRSTCPRWTLGHRPSRGTVLVGRRPWRCSRCRL